MSSHLKALMSKMAALNNAPAKPAQAVQQPAVQQPAPAVQPTAKSVQLTKLLALQASLKQMQVAPAQMPVAPQPAPLAAAIAEELGLAASVSAIAPLEGELLPKAKPNVVLNERQLEAVNMALQGKPFCLIGSAGTGKTTTEKEIVRAVSQRIEQQTEYRAGISTFKPSKHIIVCAFTRRAVRNIVKAVRELGSEYVECCKTVHKALQYKPVQEEYLDKDGELVQRKIYKAHVTRTAQNKDVQIIIIDEASMLGYSKLYRELREGFPNATFIFIGDLNQLRPVMDQPTLAYALASVPVVELNHVYRQAMDSPIVEFQYTYTLSGKVPNFTTLSKYNNEKKGLHFHALNWPKLKDRVKYNKLFVETIVVPSYKSGSYKPEEAVFLIPHRKEGTFGAMELNLEIAEFLGQQREAVVYEVIAGFQKRYFAVGDLVMFDRKEFEIVDIAANTKEYNGRQPLQPSKTLSRHGFYLAEDTALSANLFEATAVPMSTEALLQMQFNDDEEEKEQAVRKASHTLTLLDRESQESITIDTNKDILEIEFSYALTIHQSQGSEWKKVYLIMHASHLNVTREMLYTGMTRAREELVVFYSKGYSVGTDLSNSSLAKAIDRQEIVGKTWQEKALVYKMALNNGNGDLPVDMDWFMNLNSPEAEARYREFARLRDDEDILLDLAADNSNGEEG